MNQQKKKKNQFGVASIVKLSASLRFFAEGGYQTGVGKDFNVSLGQSTLSKVLTEVVDIFETHLCSLWIKVPNITEEKRNCFNFLHEAQYSWHCRVLRRNACANYSPFCNRKAISHECFASKLPNMLFAYVIGNFSSL